MIHAANNKSRLVRAAVWLEQNWGFYAQQCSPFIFGAALAWLGIEFNDLKTRWSELGGLAAACVWATSVPVWGAILSSILAIWGAHHSASTMKSLRSEADLAKGDHAKILEEVRDLRARLADAEEAEYELKATYNQLLTRGAFSILKKHSSFIEGFGDHSRVSLYAHKDGEFILAGRYTEHPDHCLPNRQRFPADQGCISEAWLNGGESYLELPDPEEDTTAYFDALKSRCNITKKNRSKLPYAQLDLLCESGQFE